MTWHESTVLEPGYNCIDAVRPVPPDLHRDTVEFQNDGGLASVFRQTVKSQKRDLDVSLSQRSSSCAVLLQTATSTLSF